MRSIALRQCLRQSALQLLKAALNVDPEVNAERPSSSLGEDLEVAPSLRVLHDAERITAPGYGQVYLWIRGELQEDASIGAALVGLPGGVEKSRAEAQCRRNVAGVADGVPNPL